ncbi:MED14-domain-containing protein [Corynespora cassiicola Philippines]|uniref:Mediator of RNA polymerase II transcription subunit 14 n=1 Tax=Corynespora cassiicola Philippines TaxID=1448308 RepID=A0A2T2NBK8_CORCC|nr:MED14-domain-containing protein [Corynespora cassiicola Philippines]
MPGRIMNHGADGATGPRDGDFKKRAYDGKMINGTPRKDTPTANGASAAPAVAQLPPEIQHLASEFYHPLSKLIVRIAQECYNDLTEVLQSMADMPVNPQANGVMANGLGSYGMANGGIDPEANKQKKLILMHFAQANRSKFIKLLVLLDWGKRSSVDVSKLIDLFQWMKDQSAQIDAVDVQLETMKVLSNYMREYNPDLRTSLEILGTGKAGWIPDMGFIPPEPISSEKALELLRYMNTALSIRLNVHETLPRHLRKWRIESGRATFVVDNEFEFDVISFADDLSDQWHFIDMRLLFTPAPSISTRSRFIGQLKRQADYILSQTGLTGCFDFLHKFILTHKITVLKSQAFELLRAGWAGSLKVEPVHRALVIQYWMDKPGRKNWIEIGISSNRPKDGKISWKGPPVSSLTVRWFRQGVEISDVDLAFDWKNLSLERMLKRVISLHIAHLLETARSNLSPKMRIKAEFSPEEPSECSLEAALGASADKTTLSMEPVTGRFILRPANHVSSQAEHFINARDPSHIGQMLMQLLARTLLDQIQRNAHQLGWLPMSRTEIGLDNVKQAVGRDILQFVLHYPRGWPGKWALATIIDASGESWWIVQMAHRGSGIVSAKQVEMHRPDGKTLPINRDFLSSMERVAAQLVAVTANQAKLDAEHQPYRIENEVATNPLSDAQVPLLHGWAIELRTCDLLESRPKGVQWLEPRMRLIFQRPRADKRNVWHIATGTVIKSEEAGLRKLVSASPQKNIGFSKSGEFYILLSSPFGESVVDELKARLRDVNRLRSFTTTLEKRKMVLRSSSLQEVRFQYGDNYTAAVNFGAESEIKLQLGQKNPHNRIHKFLTEIINDRCPKMLDGGITENSGLERFCTTLLLTRPIMTGLHEVESQEQSKGNYRNPTIHAHSIGQYRLTYQNPQCSFDIRLKPKDDKVVWSIEDNEKRAADFRPVAERSPSHKRLPKLKSALQQLFRESGESWFGVHSGIIAEMGSIPQVIKRLHETVIDCAAEEGQKPYEEVTASANAGGGNPTAPAGPRAPAPGQRPQAGDHRA